MAKITVLGKVAVLAACAAVVGCDMKPGKVSTRWYRRSIKTLAVTPGDAAEVAAVTAVEKARVQYRYRLTVLKGYYDKVGNADRYTWVSNELKNLDEAQWFTWTGAPQIVPPSGESLADADPRLLVEYVLAARKAYKQAMEELAGLYEGKDAFKAKVVARVRERLDPVRTYMYFFSAEAPAENLRPVAVVPAADALFDKALKAYRRGSLVPLAADYKRQRKALRLFLELIEKYPTSTKSPPAAFYIGHIYREYFNEDVRAVMWYRRAWQWEPKIQLGARFQAAVVYDYRLQNKEKAFELYKAVLVHEHQDVSNRRFAQQRIAELMSTE